MAKQFSLADVATWPTHERRIFVLEYLIQVQENELAKVEARCRADPDSTLDTGRAADLRVLIRELNEILNETRASSK